MGINLGLSFLGTAAARAIAALGALALSLLLANKGGIAVLGIFSFYLSLMHASAIFARCGVDMVLTKTVPLSNSTQRVAQLLEALWLGLRVSGFLVAVALIVSLLTVSDRTEITSFIILISCLPVVVCLMIMSGYLKGMRRPVFAVMLDPGGLAALAAVLMLGHFMISPQISLLSATILYGIGCLAVFCVAALYLRRIDKITLTGYPPMVKVPQQLKKSYKFWLISLSIFLGQAGSFTIAGFVLSDVDIGYLRLAERISLLTLFFLSAIDPVMAPYIVKATGDKKSLHRLWFIATSASALFALPIFLGTWWFSEEILLLVGPDAVNAEPYLHFLLYIGLFAAMTGTTSIFLALGGYEEFVLKVLTGTLILAVAGYLLLSHFFGTWGFLGVYALILVGKNIAFLFRFWTMPNTRQIE